jgi:ABC-type taurine transport system ATPase subunit
LVRFTGVQKTYDGHTLVVRDLNLNIQSGEFLSLLGPSGSGKTTTLMMLAGFESPTSGDIFLAGKPITKTPPHKRNFGMVFQNYALFPHMTIADNVAYPLTVRKVDKSRARGAGAAAKHGPVALVHVDAHADVNPDMFGERIAHGTPFRRAVEENLLDCHKVFQIGLRGSGYAADDFDWPRQQGFTLVPAHEVWYQSLAP